MTTDARIYSAASERNRDPILEVLREVVPSGAFVLEIGSGPGMHAAWFAKRLPAIVWQPSDVDPAALASIDVWRLEAEAPNLLPPVRLDVLEANWPVTRADVVYSANVIHISPWECTLALVQGASRMLPPGGLLILYGPFMMEGRHTAPSNAQFDATLRARDPRWGVRDLDAVSAAAKEAGLSLDSIRPMPANNRTVVFRRES